MFVVKVILNSWYGFNPHAKTIERHRFTTQEAARACYNDAISRVINKGYEELSVELWDPDAVLLEFWEY